MFVHPICDPAATNIETAIASAISSFAAPAAIALWECTSTQNWQRMSTEEAIAINSLFLYQENRL